MNELFKQNFILLPIKEPLKILEEIKIRRRLKQILLISVVFHLLKCASAVSTLTTVRNPELSQMEFKKFLVAAPFQDIDLRRQTENTFVTQFILSGFDAISSINLIPPVKNYSVEELLDILKTNNIDGIFIVALQDYWTSQTYIPEWSSSRGSARLYGDVFYYETIQKKYGGYYIFKPRVKFEIRLFEIKSGQIAWLATSLTRGNAFADYNTLINSLAREVIKKLKEEKVIKK